MATKKYRLKDGVQVDEVIEAGSNFGASPGDRILTSSTGRHVHIKKEEFLALFEPEASEPPSVLSAEGALTVGELREVVKDWDPSLPVRIKLAMYNYEKDSLRFESGYVHTVWEKSDAPGICLHAACTMVSVDPHSSTATLSVQRAFVQLANGDARIVLNVHYDGVHYHVVHVSGPSRTVKEYFDGEITLEQLREEFSKPRRFRR